MRLQNDFYRLNAIEAAQRLVGKLICVKQGDSILKRRITETECYFGQDDTACHASKGKTKRTEIMFHSGGVAYVYLCYGIHNILNVITGEQGHPEGVMIRSVEGANGPGRVTKYLGITMDFNAEDLIKSSRLWLEDDGFECKLQSGKRIGIDYAKASDRDKLWRFKII